MNHRNQTPVTYFIITGISEVPEFQAPIFLLVVVIYLITLFGNMTIFLIVCLDSQLHTPMYFLLGNLSILNMFSTTIALHMVIASFLTGNHVVSLPRCLGQMYIFSSMSMDELFLLTAMSYDRYVAICKPLHYHMVMNRRVCALLALVSWLLGFMAMLTFLIFYINSCFTSNVVNHFFCDFVPLSTITCIDPITMKILLFTIAMCGAVILPFIMTFISYVFIIITILRIRTSSGRRKAFYTCSSQLTVVILLYVILVFQYVKPATADSLDKNKMYSLFNTAAVPVLNPLIYSLKNKDVKSALKRRLRPSQISA